VERAPRRDRGAARSARAHRRLAARRRHRRRLDPRGTAALPARQCDAAPGRLTRRAAAGAGLLAVPASKGGGRAGDGLYAVLLPADQATVTAEDLRRLAGTWRKQPQYIAAALYAGITGVPAIFPRSVFRELAELRGDAGARVLLRRSTERLVRVTMPSAAVDIDTPEDLLALDAPK